MEIIIKDEVKLGKTRSEQEQNLRKEWGPTITDEQLDKCKFLERKLKEKTGRTQNFLTPIELDKIE